MSLNSLQDLFVEQLQDLYSAEQQFAEAQVKVADATASDELKQGIQMHIEQTKEQIGRLEQIAETLGLGSLKGKTCQAAKGLVAEAEELLEEDGDAQVKDAGIIAALQRVEHYEMAGYGTVVAYARRLGHEDAVPLLEQTLEEEKATDAKLSQLAETSINAQAV
jgi:ferritin-like metal-binding protein YciE